MVTFEPEMISCLHFWCHCALQVGDQILSINGIKMAGYSLQEALKLVQEADNEIELEVMYEVHDASPPSSGIFDVHLKKTGSLNLGITINGMCMHTFM